MMNERRVLEKKLREIEILARGPVIKRLFKDPVRYISAIVYWRVIYPLKKSGKFKRATTFFGTDMQVVLPSATEIYLFGAKTHDSEIRLARFLMNQLNPGDSFCDVGAHFGYFTLLASMLTGEKGKVISFEASQSTFDVLQKNTAGFENIIIENQAAADENKVFVFHEYPVLLSEYNSLIKPGENEFINIKNNPPREIKIPGIKLSDYFFDNHIYPKIIKIDVEGAELQVLTGLHSYLKKEVPVLVMEYLLGNSQNQVHEQAIDFMKQLGYRSYIIDENGKLTFCEHIKSAMAGRQLESDNIVFKINND